MAFAQLANRESLRAIENLRVQAQILAHMDLPNVVSRNTLPNANQARDWRDYSDLTPLANCMSTKT